MADFFAQNFILIYFFYGLSFFCMGLAVLLEAGRASELDFARALRPLGFFGLVHGSHEWLEMFLLILAGSGRPVEAGWVPLARLLLLGVSFMFLVSFGARLIAGPMRFKIQAGMIAIITTLWLGGMLGVGASIDYLQGRVVAADVYTRYALAIPGAALTVAGLLLQRQRFKQMGMEKFGRDAALAAVAFGLYGGIGQLFASPSVIFPSAYLNAEMFARWFGFPIQLFRAVVATMAAVYIIRSLRAFEVDNTRRMAELHDRQLKEQHRLEELRAELLRRTVKAQESERQRIARELHDETGQTLTALGMGLRGLSETIETNPARASQQAKHLENLASGGIKELQRMVSGLHPPQLDDLGLAAALRWYAGDTLNRFDIPVNLEIQGAIPELAPEVRMVLFRIAQEAITNVVRHAQADKIELVLKTQAEAVQLSIADDGDGFDVQAVLSQNPQIGYSWGLLGMQERASLVGGSCDIISQPGEGTRIEVSVPINDKRE